MLYITRIQLEEFSSGVSARAMSKKRAFEMGRPAQTVQSGRLAPIKPVSLWTAFRACTSASLRGGIVACSSLGYHLSPAC